MKATYIDHMGTDLSVVNAAKVSFGKKSQWEGGSHPIADPDRKLSKGDQGLIQFLARGCTSGDWTKITEEIANKGFDRAIGHGNGPLVELLNHIRRMPPHWTPFAHTAITLHLKMPIFVARQIMKTSTGMVYNEISRRYVDGTPEFYTPDSWRKRAANVKQGSSDEAVLYMDYGEYVKDEYDAYLTNSHQMYDQLLLVGISPEQARMVLPQSMYTEVIATGNLYSWANMFIQRTDSHAQKETQDLAHQIGEIVEPLFSVSWKALTQ